jgi:hypothetical protein
MLPANPKQEYQDRYIILHVWKGIIFELDTHPRTDKQIKVLIHAIGEHLRKKYSEEYADDEEAMDQLKNFEENLFEEGNVLLSNEIDEFIMIGLREPLPDDDPGDDLSEFQAIATYL